MSHKVTFLRGLHCLLRQNLSSDKELQYVLKILKGESFQDKSWIQDFEADFP